MDSKFLLIIILLVLGFLLPFMVFLIRNLKSILPYLYINARISAKEARLLKPETLDEMVNTGSVAEIASILENSEYALAMQGLVLDSSEAIEDLLVRQTADIYTEIAGMLPENMAKVFSFLRKQWDVRNLKTILRGVRRGLTVEEIISKIVPFGELGEDIMRKMAESSDVEDLFPFFETTCFSPVTALLPDYEQHGSLLPVEFMLDRILLEDMWKHVSSDRDLAALQPGLSARIDALNLKTLFRAKRDKIPFSDVKNYLIKAGQLPEGVLQVFDEVDEVSALISELEGTVFFKPLMDVLPEFEKDGSLLVVEKALEETVLSEGREGSVKQPYGVAPVLGYLSRKEAEVRNIRAIVRAKEAGMPPERIKQYVLGI